MRKSHVFSGLFYDCVATPNLNFISKGRCPRVVPGSSHLFGSDLSELPTYILSGFPVGLLKAISSAPLHPGSTLALIWPKPSVIFAARDTTCPAI